MGFSSKTCWMRRDNIGAGGGLPLALFFSHDIININTLNGDIKFMDALKNITVTLGNKQYHVLYVGIHGGSGLGANYPYNGRYYLVSSDFFEKERANYCMVHDSVLPKAWNYYENEGYFLLEGNDYPGIISQETLIACISRLEPEILELMGINC